MAAYFASDVHLRLDRPERGRRFARWVDTLGADDPLTIVGDLCDFWYAARQHRTDPMACMGLRALAAYRARGGVLTIVLGNHDAWLGPFYRDVLGAEIVGEPLDVTIHGLRLRLVHGHLLGARPAWKRGLESRGFLAGFRALPGPVAGGLNILLDRNNARTRAPEDARHLEVFRGYAAERGSDFDLVIFGHMHRPVDERGPGARLVVLGGWKYQSSYLKIDRTGAIHVVEPDPEAVAIAPLS